MLFATLSRGLVAAAEGPGYRSFFFGFVVVIVFFREREEKEEVYLSAGQALR